MLSGEIALKNTDYYYYSSSLSLPPLMKYKKKRKQQKVLRDEFKICKDAVEVDLRLNYGTMRIVIKDIHKQFDIKDMYGANKNSHYSL